MEQERDNKVTTKYFAATPELLEIAARIAQLEGLSGSAFINRAVASEVKQVLKSKPHFLAFLEAEGVQLDVRELRAA